MRSHHRVLVILLFINAACQPTKVEEIQLDAKSAIASLFAPHTISTELYERDIAITADGKTIIYTLGDYKQTKRCLVKIEKEGLRWGQKKILPFSGQYQDIEPFFSVDGKRLYFASNRPIYGDISRTDYNIWYVDRRANDWSEPIALAEVINTEKDEFYPSVSANNTLYFTATRSDGVGREDIFRSQLIAGEFQQPEALDTFINSKVFEFNAYINPTEDLLIFSSFGRRDGFGGGDLYFSRKGSDGQWQKAKNMGDKINTPHLDYCPFIDFERGNFYFTSEKVNSVGPKITTIKEFNKQANKPLNGLGNIFKIDMKILDLE